MDPLDFNQALNDILSGRSPNQGARGRGSRSSPSADARATYSQIIQDGQPDRTAQSRANRGGRGKPPDARPMRELFGLPPESVSNRPSRAAASPVEEVMQDFTPAEGQTRPRERPSVMGYVDDYTVPEAQPEQRGMGSDMEQVIQSLLDDVNDPRLSNRRRAQSMSELTAFLPQFAAATAQPEPVGARDQVLFEAMNLLSNTDEWQLLNHPDPEIRNAAIQQVMGTLVGFLQGSDPMMQTIFNQ